jgi:hypothetical protein
VTEVDIRIKDGGNRDDGFLHNFAIASSSAPKFKASSTWIRNVKRRNNFGKIGLKIFFCAKFEFLLFFFRKDGLPSKQQQIFVMGRVH